MSEMVLTRREMSPLGAASEDEESDTVLDAAHDKLTRNRLMHWRVRLGLVVLAVAASIALLYHSFGQSAHGAYLTVATWNIAAINNNPFEYWITHDDADYNQLMTSVQDFIDAPDETKDVPVREVFKQSQFKELRDLMAAEGWSGLDETETRWIEDLSKRHIISGFLKDKSLGDKRLTSMPDRVTNTINTLSQGVVYRPTVINCFDGDMSSMRKWWREWKNFMFNFTLKLQGTSSAVTRPAAMLQKIKQSKYPAITAEEEAISIPLQTLCQAIFDAILVHIVTTVSPTPGKWQTLRLQMCEALNKRKDERTKAILDNSYADADVIFLQEAAAAFLSVVRSSSLGSRYIVGHAASLDGKRDQNSLILLRRGLFREDSIQEHTATVMGGFAGRKVPVAEGDLLVLSVDDVMGRQFLLASFHGDTNGLATKPVLAEVHKLAQSFPQRKLIFGLDANTYERGSSDKQDVLDWATDYVSKGYTSCWGDVPNPKNHTTFNARTFLQAQLQKAAKSTEMAAKGDKNPKDFILFRKDNFAVMSTTKDNTGKRSYTENMVFPTLAFPSDHGIVATKLSFIQPSA